MIGLAHYLTVAAILFTIGVLGIFLNRRNIILMLMAIELILLAVNINLVAFSAYLGDLHGAGVRDVRADRRRRRGRDRARHPGHLLPPPRLDRGRRRRPDARLMDISLQLIVFLPLLAAIVAGLGGRVIGNIAAKVVTTGALLIGAVLSWPIFLDYLSRQRAADGHRRARMDQVGRRWTSTGRCASTR